MKEQNNDQFDLRLITYRLRQDIVTKESYEAYLKSLPDCTKNADYIDVTFEPKVEEVTERSDSYGSLAFTPADNV